MDRETLLEILLWVAAYGGIFLIAVAAGFLIAKC